MKKKQEPKHPITQWDETQGLMAKERGKARAFLLPDDVVLLAKAGELEHHNRDHRDDPRNLSNLYEENRGAFFARRSLVRESEGFSEAIHERIVFLNWEHPDHAQYHAAYMAYAEPRIALENTQHRRNAWSAYCPHCPNQTLAPN